MQVYKSHGAVERAKQLYDEYSAVDKKWEQIKDIIVSKRRARPLNLFDNISKSHVAVANDMA